MRIIFMGTPDYAAVILESLLKNHKVCALVCGEDKRAGRDMHLKVPATKALLQKHSPEISILQPKMLDENFIKTIKSFACDMIIVAAFGKILPKAVLEIAPCVNLHASILPRFRGASPIQQSILENECFFGVTLMQMQEGLDCGDILGFKVIRNSKQGAIELFDILAKCAAELTLEYIQRYEEINPLKQINADASYCKKIKKESGCVCFDNARALESKSLAYDGWPGIFLSSGLKLKGVRAKEYLCKYRSGEILEIKEDSIRVGCKRGSVWIDCLQAPSKKLISAYQYLQGKHLKVGSILE